ncbi:MAG: Flp pilus assembly complex ATPase component TadA [Armatimonadota bacterium]|nr:MAG: Flp pilus assembly complex ATPase component TadA [Armatimonadota bacterium]
MAQSPGDPLAEVLVEAGVISRDELETAAAARNGAVERLDETVARLGLAREEDIYSALARHLGLEYAPDVDRDICPALLAQVPSEFAMRHQVLPLREEDHTLVVAMGNPFDVTVLDDLRLLTSRDVRAVVASPRRISEAIEQCYMEKMFRDIDDMQTEELAEEDLEIADLQKMAREALVIKLVNLIMHQAVQARSSDIHIEPHERELRVRYRVDGVLHDASSPPRHLHPAIISRIKIMADMDIAERRRPQDGRVRIKLGDRMIDLRISTIPTLHGESVVIRLLDRSAGRMALTDLGMREDTFALYRRVISRPHGIILATGPTGSGKSTTLHAALHEVYSAEKKVITIEEPVEYELAGANQINVLPEIGLTFAAGLRHIVRQDPDIIMVGEIRDRETADIAIHAALTGHLVFSTVHTNDAAGAVTRLLDMGIEPYLVASSLVGVLAQRLVRTLCPRCKLGFEPTAEDLREISITSHEAGPITLYRAGECDLCRKGYLGRTGVFELLQVDDEVQHQVLDKISSNDIRQRAVEKGMVTLLADGREKVLEGRTTIEEVVRICQRDEM